MPIVVFAAITCEPELSNKTMMLFGMTKTRFFLFLGILGVLAIIRRLKEKTKVLRSAESDPQEINSGAFPPEIVERQFENFLS